MPSPSVHKKRLCREAPRNADAEACVPETSVIRQRLTADTLAKVIIQAGVLNVEEHRRGVTGGETGEGKYSSLAAGWSSSSWIAGWMG
jgi:hypothetical protein